MLIDPSFKQQVAVEKAEFGDKQHNTKADEMTELSRSQIKCTTSQGYFCVEMLLSSNRQIEALRDNCLKNDPNVYVWSKKWEYTSV